METEHDLIIFSDAEDSDEGDGDGDGPTVETRVEQRRLVNFVQEMTTTIEVNTENLVDITEEMGENKRCGEEIRDIQDRPIDGVHYDTVTTYEENGVQLSMLEFDVKKYDTVLQIILPKKFPAVPPRVQFGYKNIPVHPTIDSESGVIDGLWSNGGEWSPKLQVRDVCVRVLEILANANTPAVISPPKDRDRESENAMRVIVSKAEFLHLCKYGDAFVGDLKLRYKCMIKYRFKKNQREPPYVLIDWCAKPTAEIVAAALDGFLVRSNVRQRAMFVSDPEPDASKYISHFARPSAVAPAAYEDVLMVFDDATFVVGPGGDCGSNVGESGTYAMDRGGASSGLIQGAGNAIFIPDETSVSVVAEMINDSVRDLGVNDWRVLGLMKWKLDLCLAKADERREQRLRRGDFIGTTNFVMANQRSEIIRLRNALGEKQRHAAHFECKVCMYRITNAGLSCGHTFCLECAGKIGGSCLICRKEIKSIVKIFV